MKQTIQFCFLLGSFAVNLHAQSHTDAAGGNATGSGGSLSYSIGQIDFTRQAGTTGVLTLGVQQPFEINYFTGIKDELNETDATIFPNPVSDILKIQVNDPIHEALFYELFDLSGKSIVKKGMNGKLAELNVSGLPDGMYFLNINAPDKKVKTFKLIVNK
jgi:hypothetical protein